MSPRTRGSIPRHLHQNTNETTVKTIKIKCYTCGMVFKKNMSEYNRIIKSGRRSFWCSLSCYSTHCNVFRLKPSKKPSVAPVLRDEYTPFRWFMARIRYRQGATNVTHKFLANLWLKQNGKCPITGLDMILPHSTNGFAKGKSPVNASLDRIDNTRGYHKDNIRFISFMANVARADFSDAQLIQFCIAVAKRHTQNQEVV